MAGIKIQTYFLLIFYCHNSDITIAQYYILQYTIVQYFLTKQECFNKAY